MDSQVKGRDSKPPSKQEKRKRRKQVLVACNRCRRLRTRCDTVRPSCGHCHRTSTTCVYDTEDPQESRSQAVRRKYDDLQTLQEDANDSLNWLRLQSADTAATCIRRLQDTADPLRELCAVVAEERAGRLSPGIPEHEVLIGSSRTVQNTLTAELGIRYPASFPWLPDELLPPPKRNRTPAPPYWHDPVHSPGLPKLLPKIYTSRRDNAAESLICHSSVNARLQDLEISFWTTVPISNELAANIISLYVRVEQPVYGFFDPDAFLGDLIAQQTRYCSSLLVNSVLFWSCCTFGPIYPEARGLASAFLEASQRLLEGERSVNSPVNVASLMILAISTICFGKNALAKECLVGGVRMAEDLCLFGEPRQAVGYFSAESIDTLSMLSYAAWGAFNFSSVYLLHFHDVQGGTYTTRPPLLPKPGSTAFYEQIRAKDEHLPPLSVHSNGTFPYFCEFWCLAHEIGSVLYSATGPLHQHVPLAFVESKFLRLLQWAETLPLDARRSEGMPHNVAEMHICYHATIMDLFRPFLAKGQVLATFAASPRRPEAIFALSLSHLRALSRYYHTNFVGLPESHTISWVHGPLYVAPAILHYERRKGWEAEFFSFIEACTDLLKAHQMMEGFLRALLGMAVFAEMLTVAQATEYLDSLRATRDAGHHYGIPDTGFVIDQDLAVESRDAAVGDALVQRFDEMLFFDDPIEHR